MKDLKTFGKDRYELPVGPHKNQHFGSERAIKLAVITGAAVLCVIVAFLVITSLLSAPGAGTTAEANRPRFANLNEMDPVREPENNPSAGEREGGQNQPQQQGQQEGDQEQQTEQERLSNDLREQQKTQEQQEEILQEQRDAIPSPMGENPPEPANLSP